MRVTLIAAILALGAPFAASAQISCEDASEQYNQLTAQTQQCAIQMDRANAQSRRMAMQGIPAVAPPPPCEAYMYQWIANMRLLEATLGHCQGDPRPLCEQQGYPRGCNVYRQR